MAEPKFSLTEIKGDLFSSNESLAHCVSEDFNMGKGIATGFKKHFGRVSELLKSGTRTGGCTFLKDKNRFIFYLVTKKKYWGKPNYASLTSSLKVMKELCIENKVNRLSIPKIAAGLDGLDWDEVKRIIAEVFHDIDIEITVYLWDGK